MDAAGRVVPNPSLGQGRFGRRFPRLAALGAAGHTQPEAPEWNRLGYVNNAIQEVLVHLR